ncbi:hypothetical protein F5Y10DRAFT_264161 [Nemania abortiva]|nr:hypothetical protein F5Y10DRAFT_264161 [Nemania abortiva]
MESVDLPDLEGQIVEPPPYSEQEIRDMTRRHFEQKKYSEVPFFFVALAFYTSFDLVVHFASIASLNIFLLLFPVLITFIPPLVILTAHFFGTPADKLCPLNISAVSEFLHFREFRLLVAASWRHTLAAGARIFGHSTPTGVIPADRVHSTGYYTLPPRPRGPRFRTPATRFRRTIEAYHRAQDV